VDFLGAHDVGFPQIDGLDECHISLGACLRTQQHAPSMPASPAKNSHFRRSLRA
jgi:hypothetical protein